MVCVDRVDRNFPLASAHRQGRLRAMATVEAVQELIRRRDKVEADIKELLGVLKTHGVGMHDALVDDEGFPRNDIDIPAVRTARQQVICLRNDAKALTKEIEEGLVAVHSQVRKERGEQASEAASPTSPTSPTSQKPLVPFLRVGQVSDGSPAQDAGFREGDLVCRLGSVTFGNFSGLQDVATVTQHSENRPIQVSLLRNGQRKDLILKPRKWSGRGLLGCHVVSIKS